MTFAGRWSGAESLRGIVVRLPVGHEVLAAVAAGLDFVAVDLVGGPVDEVGLWRLAATARAAGIGVVAIAEGESERLVGLGADVVVDPADGTLRVVDEVDATVEDGQRVALDVIAVTSRAMRDFAAAVTATSPPVPLVLLPGMLGSAKLFADVVALLDGEVSARPLRIDVDETVADAAESVIAAAPPRFALAGHSLGGIVALEVLRRVPHRVARLALLNSSARPPTDSQLETWARLEARTQAGEFSAVVTEQAAANVGEVAAQHPELVERWKDLARDVGPEGFVRQLSMQSSRSDNRPWLGDIAVPTLVVSGELDAVCPREIQAEMAAAIPGADHVVLEGAGHMSPLDQPEELATALRTWLQR